MCINMNLVELFVNDFILLFANEEINDEALNQFVAGYSYKTDYPVFF